MPIFDFFNKFKTYIAVIAIILTIVFLFNVSHYVGDVIARFFGGDTKESLQKENSALKQGLDIYQTSNQNLYDLSKTEKKVDVLADSLYDEHKKSQKETVDKINSAKRKFESKKSDIKTKADTKKITVEETDRQRAINQYQLISEAIKATHHE